MSHLEERLSTFRFKYVWRENIFFTSTSETFVKQKLLQILPVFTQNPEIGPKAFGEWREKMWCEWGFFFILEWLGIECFGLVWDVFVVAFCLFALHITFPEIGLWYSSMSSVCSCLFSSSLVFSSWDLLSFLVKRGWKVYCCCFCLSTPKAPCAGHLFPEIAFLQSSSSLV